MKDKILDVEQVFMFEQTAQRYTDLCAKRQIARASEDYDTAVTCDAQIKYLNELILKSDNYQTIVDIITTKRSDDYVAGDFSNVGKADSALFSLKDGLINSRTSDLVDLSRQQYEAEVNGDTETVNMLDAELRSTCQGYVEQGIIGDVCDCLEARIHNVYDTIPTDFPSPSDMAEVKIEEDILKNASGYVLSTDWKITDPFTTQQ